MYSLPFDVQSESPSTRTTRVLSATCLPTMIATPTRDDPRLSAGHMCAQVFTTSGALRLESICIHIL